MNFHKKVVASETSPKKRRWLPLLTLLAVPFTALYLNNKKIIDRELIKAADKVIDFAKSSEHDSVADKKEKIHRINLKDIKKEPQPFSYEAAETDPKVMGDPNKINENMQKQYKEYLASNAKKSAIDEISDHQVKKVKYRVKKGDDAQLIADAFEISVADLKRSNTGVDWSNLKKGQTLNITLIAGGPAGATTDYSEQIPQAYANKKINKTTKAKKTKVSSKKSKQIAELQKEKEKTGKKKETLQAVVDQKNSKPAKENPKENQKNIDKTIDQSNLNNKEKKVAKEMSKEKDDKSLKEAKELLEKKEQILETAIQTSNPLYYYQWPREMHDFTFNKEQRDNSYAFFLLKAVNSGMGIDGIKIYEVPGIELQGWAVCYFLNLRTANFFSENFSFKSNGETITNRRTYEELKELLSKRDGIRNVYQQADVAYKAHWHEWVARFGNSASVQSPAAPK
jgi:murein DD-endopeptidase MepM/ murein hydrolase activator NlpD